MDQEFLGTRDGRNIDMANIYSQGINFGTLDETNKFNTI